MVVNQNQRPTLLKKLAISTDYTFLCICTDFVHNHLPGINPSLFILSERKSAKIKTKNTNQHFSQKWPHSTYVVHITLMHVQVFMFLFNSVDISYLVWKKVGEMSCLTVVNRYSIKWLHPVIHTVLTLLWITPQAYDGSTGFQDVWLRSFKSWEEINL